MTPTYTSEQVDLLVQNALDLLAAVMVLGLVLIVVMAVAWGVARLLDE